MIQRKILQIVAASGPVVEARFRLADGRVDRYRVVCWALALLEQVGLSAADDWKWNGESVTQKVVGLIVSGADLRGVDESGVVAGGIFEGYDYN